MYDKNMLVLHFYLKSNYFYTLSAKHINKLASFIKVIGVHKFMPSSNYKVS